MFKNKPIIKLAHELQIMRDGGKILALIVKELSKEVVEGNNSLEVDKYANFLCKRYKVKPAFLGYGGFKGTICANLNQIVVHGTPSKVTFKNKDIFGLDMGIIYNGFVLDMSVTLKIGEVDKEVEDFLDKTLLSMNRGIDAARVDNKIGDIVHAMNFDLISPQFSLMRDFVGHGIGRNLHEAPEIPGIGMKPGEGDTVKEGMVFAIESISVMGPTNEYEIDKDKWTVWTKDKKYLSGLYEHTVIVTKDGPEIITG